MCLSCSLCRGHFSPRCRAAVPAGKNWIWLALICLDLADGWVLWNEQGWRKVFSPGAMAPLLSQCHCLLPPALKWWKHSVIHCHQVTPNATALLPAMVPGNDRWTGWGITSHTAPLPWGDVLRDAHQGYRMPPVSCPPALLSTLRRCHRAELVPAAHWDTALAPPQACARASMMGKISIPSPPPAVPWIFQSHEVWNNFFSFYNPNALLKKQTHFLPFLVKGV